jgi:hypothetical protein
MNTRSIVLALGLSLSATFAVAQTTAMNTQLAGQVQQAANAGDANKIAELARDNPASAVTIAQAAVQVAQQIAATNPAGAAQLAAVATRIVAAPAVVTAAPAAAAQVAASATAVVANPTVANAAPGAVAQVTANANRIASNPAVQQAAPQAVTNIQNNLANAPAPAQANNPLVTTPQIPNVDPVISNNSPSSE